MRKIKFMKIMSLLVCLQMALPNSIKAVTVNDLCLKAKENVLGVNEYDIECDVNTDGNTNIFDIVRIKHKILSEELTNADLTYTIIVNPLVIPDNQSIFSTVKSAVEATQDPNKPYYDKEVTIEVHSGEYDLLDEFGGLEWLNTITHEHGERQGLFLPNRVNLKGVGNVIFKFRLPDNATYVQTQCTSCINLGYSNTLENITFIAENCRYTCHDEANGGNRYIKRYVKNCRFIHLGNKEGMWPYPTVMGGGSSGGSSYDWINCQFITNSYPVAFSYHTNNDTAPSHFNIDGCVGICNSSTGKSFRCASYGTVHAQRTIFNFKNCSGNGLVVKELETWDGTSVDHIEMYNNGYNTIDDVSNYAYNLIVDKK